MTSRYTNVVPSTSISSYQTPTNLTNGQKTLYLLVRTELKARTYSDRATLRVYDHLYLQRIPICPICSKVVPEPSMHEVFLTRGDVQGAPFDTQIKIYVPQNVVLIHEGDCHLKAQHEKAYKMLCVRNILMYHSEEEIRQWLEEMNHLLRSTAVNEARALIQEALASSIV